MLVKLFVLSAVLLVCIAELSNCVEARSDCPADCECVLQASLSKQYVAMLNTARLRSDAYVTPDFFSSSSQDECC